MATKKTKEPAMMGLPGEMIELPGIDIGFVTIEIIGDSPLIVHKWQEKSKKEMLDKQMKKASNGKDAKNPPLDFVNSLYWLDENGNLIDTPEELADITPDTPIEEVNAVLGKGRFGFPTCGFKSCAIDAGYQQGVIAKKTTARGAFHILGEYAVIEGFPTIREDSVQVGTVTRSADIRHRPEFKQWKTTLTIKYNKKAISMAQIINLMNYGGFSNGVGEWRPSRGGSFGTFHCE